MAAPKLFLIDAHALCYRSFFAIRGLTSSKGQETNAIYGFVNTLRKILREYHPEYLAVCFDSKGKTHRQEKFNAYKIQRPVMPTDLIDQMPLIKEIVKAYNLAQFECPGFEADDIIATIARAAFPKGMEVVIVSDDKDLYQLADEHLAFVNSRQEALVGVKELHTQLGFHPSRITDFIALAGDKSDNIPGVKGVGEITARRLIEEYDNLENIFKHLAEIKPGKLREKLETNKDQAVLSKELAVLTAEVPLDLHVEDLKVGTPQQDRLLSLFHELEFNKFAKELASETSPHESFPATGSLKDEGEINAWIKKITKQEQFAFLPCQSQLIVSAGPREHCLVPIKQFAQWQEIFTHKKILKITYDLKESVKILNKTNVAVGGNIFDVFLAAYLAGVPQGSLNFEGLAWTYLKKSTSAQEDPNRQMEILWELYPHTAKEISEKSLTRLLKEIEIPLAFVLADMETCGVNIDVALLEGFSKECQRKIDDLVRQLYRLAGTEFNLNSPKQLSGVLFEHLKLPVVKKTKTGFSTDEEVLTALARQHEVPALILEYRQLAKLKSTYLDALPKLVNPQTGRVHAQFHQTGAETGRLSSSQPNLQNIPIRSELGSQIRKAIIPLSTGDMIVAADYSQIELRILAHLSQDPALIKAFKGEEDIHKYTASLIFEVPESKVTPAQRDTAKRVNFGISYGMSAFGLAKDLGISQEDAQDFIDRYFLRYPKVKDFMDQAIRVCAQNGYVTTLLDRRRYIPEINSPNNSLRLFAQRQAINTPVQGSAADMMKLAMIEIHNGIQKRKLASQILICVHDELVLNVPKRETEEIIALLRQKMEHPFEGAGPARLEFTVPIKVTVKCGANWLEMKEIA